MRQRVGLKLRRRQGNHARRRQHVAQVFGVEEEEDLVLPDRSADAAAELMGIRPASGRARGVIEERVGVELFPVEVVEQIAVELVRAGDADHVDLGAGHASVLRAIGVHHDRHFATALAPSRLLLAPELLRLLAGSFWSMPSSV